MQGIEILSDPARMGAFRDDTSASMYAPSKHNLSGRAAPHQRDIGDHRILEQKRRLIIAIRRRTIRRIHVPKGRVRGDVDAVVFVQLYPIVLLQVRVELELVEGGLDGRAADEVSQLVWIEVRDANVADFAGSEKLLHGVPCLTG